MVEMTIRYDRKRGKQLSISGADRNADGFDNYEIYFQNMVTHMNRIHFRHYYTV